MPNRFWTLILPLIVLGIQCIMEVTLTSAQLVPLLTENSPMELMQWVVIALAAVVALISIVPINPAQRPWLFAWVMIAALACIYIVGEEVSWGQHFLNWSTPDHWAAINDQNETNLHNTSSWLDQKPRLVLMIGIIVGGIICPLLQKFKPGTLPEKFTIIYPPMILMPVALLVIGPYLLQDVTEHIWEGGFFERVSELQELYMYYFVLLYMIVLRRRVLDKDASPIR